MAPRVRAWLLLALFLGAGTSLPSPDALLFHLRPDPTAGRVHVEPAGGCTAHSEHCTLGRTPPGSRSVAAPIIAVRISSSLRRPSGPIPPVPALEARAASLPHSRAPPAPLT